jgi:hypothetical protein
VATGGFVFGSCPNLKFYIVEQGTGAAIVIFTNAGTQFINGACAGISGALQVQVTGIRQADGSIVASAVQSQDHIGG